MTDAARHPLADWRGDDAPPTADSASLATVVDLVRRGVAATRPELAARSGWGRKVVSHRVDEAITLGLLAEGPLAPSGGGRQPRTLRFRAEAAHIVVMLFGSSAIIVAAVSLDGTVLADVEQRWDVSAGPEASMSRALAMSDDVRRRVPSESWAVVVGVSGPVDSRTSTLFRPPNMPGWDAFSPRDWLRGRLDLPVWVDNDANLMALAEASRAEAARDLLFVKVGSGIGAGLFLDGRLVHGHRGGAGDLGHLRATDDPQVVCRCGRTGCLDAVAGGWSLLAEARARSADSPVLARRDPDEPLTLVDIGAAVRAGDEVVEEMCRRRMHAVAEVVADLADFVNPGAIVLGGGVLEIGPIVLERFRDAVRANVSELTAEGLDIRASALGRTAGIVGGGVLGIERLLARDRLARWAADGSPVRRAALLQQHP